MKHFSYKIITSIVKNFLIKQHLLINIILLFLTVQRGFTQKQITLKDSSFKIEANNFYIKKVIDSRKNKNDIGYTKNDDGDKIIITLNPQTPIALQQFIDQSLQKNTSFTPVIMQVLYLKVEEERSGIFDITARAGIKLAFYEEDQKGLKKICTVEHHADKIFDEDDQANIIHFQEKKIRSLVIHCLKIFAKKRQVNSTSIVYVDPQALNQITSDEELIITKAKPLGKWNNLITFRQIYTRHQEGIKVSYVGFSDRYQKIIKPFIFSFNKYKTKPEVIQNSEYESVDSYVMSVGFKFYIRLFSEFFAAVDLQAPLGVEVLQDKQNQKQSNFLYGATSRQGIMYIPKTSWGLTFGAGFFQQWQNSKLYNTDWGFEFEIGIKF